MMPFEKPVEVAESLPRRRLGRSTGGRHGLRRRPSLQAGPLRGPGRGRQDGAREGARRGHGPHPDPVAVLLRTGRGEGNLRMNYKKQAPPESDGCG